jgi:cytochrome P450
MMDAVFKQEELSMSRIIDIPTSRMANFFRFQRDPLGFLLDALPVGDVVSLRTESYRPTFVINSPEFVQEILVHQEASFRKGRSSNVLRRTIGDGLLTTEQSLHRHQKKYLTPAFYKERIQSYADIVAEETERFVRTLTVGEAVPMHDAMMQLTLSIIARSMFRVELEEEKEELAAAVDDTIRISAKTIFSPFVLPFSIPTPSHRTHKRAIRTLETMVYDAIASAKRDPERYADSLLGMLMDTKDEKGEPISDEEIRDQMMTMLLAGHETTANALVWALYCLEQEPEAAQKLHREVSVLKQAEERSGQRLSAFERYRELSYSRQVVQETLRLYPPAWAILREADEEVHMLGDAFPANSSFLISPYAIHRNELVFKEAPSFRPERFEGEQDSWPRFAYFPFGGGARGCIGSQFAMMEAVLILSILAERFRFVSVSGQGEAIPEPLVSLRIKGGRWMLPQLHEPSIR